MIPHDQEIHLGQNYRLIFTKKLGNGAFGEIFLGMNLKTMDEVAIKMESAKSKHPQLHYEAKVMKYLQGGTGIPAVYNYYSSGDYNFLIMDLLGPSLEDLLNRCHRKFSIKTVLLLAEQMLSRLEYLHSRHFIHRDIKPDNFLMGRGKNYNQVYMIDFGLAKRFRDPKTGLHIPYKDGKSLTGTARYASIYTHLGIEQSRRDDLEAWAYMLIYLILGTLPWQGLRAKSKKEKYKKIMEKKIAITPESLCEGLPEEFSLFLHFARNLQFEEKPDYLYLHRILQNMFISFNFENDFAFDWNINIFQEQKKESADADLSPITKEDNAQEILDSKIPEKGSSFFYSKQNDENFL